MGSSSIFMIRSYSLSQKVLIFGTDPLDMFNATTFAERTQITDFYSKNAYIQSVQKLSEEH